VVINHTGAITLTGGIEGSLVSLQTGATTATAINATSAAAVLTATTGNLTLTSAGGMTLANATLNGNGVASDIILQSGNQAVTVGAVTTTGYFSSTGGSTFATTTGKALNIDIGMTLAHAGTVTLNSDATIG